MPPLDDTEIQDMHSSSVPDQTDASQTTDTQVSTEAPADPSPAKGEKELSTLDVVRDVVAKKSGTASPAEGAEEGQPTGAAASRKELDPENYTDVHFHKHPRFQQLIQERNSFRQDADRYRNVETFLHNNGLSADEAADALVIAGLARLNPREAFERVKPWVLNLAIAAGEILPEDLQQRVQRGEMSPEVAMEVSRHRATTSSIQNATQITEQRRQDQEQQTLQKSIVDAATDWEADRKIKDPNYGAKAVAIRKEVAYLQREEGMPNTPQGVKDMLQKAYKAVNESFRPAVPNPRPQKTAMKPVVGGQVSGNVRSAPKSTLDIIHSIKGGVR